MTYRFHYDGPSRWSLTHEVERVFVSIAQPGHSNEFPRIATWMFPDKGNATCFHVRGLMAPTCQMAYWDFWRDMSALHDPVEFVKRAPLTATVIHSNEAPLPQACIEAYRSLLKTALAGIPLRPSNRQGLDGGRGIAKLMVWSTQDSAPVVHEWWQSGPFPHQGTLPQLRTIADAMVRIPFFT